MITEKKCFRINKPISNIEIIPVNHNDFENVHYLNIKSNVLSTNENIMINMS